MVGVDESSSNSLPIGFLIMLIIGVIIIIVSIIVGKLLFQVKQAKIAQDVYEGKY